MILLVKSTTTLPPPSMHTHQKATVYNSRSFFFFCYSRHQKLWKCFFPWFSHYHAGFLVVVSGCISRDVLCRGLIGWYVFFVEQQQHHHHQHCRYCCFKTNKYAYKMYITTVLSVHNLKEGECKEGMRKRARIEIKTVEKRRNGKEKMYTLREKW